MLARFIHRRFVSRMALDKLAPIKSGLFWQAHQDDPLKHSQEHEGLYYTLPNDQLAHIFANPKPMPSELQKFCLAVNQTNIMIRRPALDLIGYLKNLDYSKPATRFLLFGEFGAGKTMTLTHLMHHTYNKGENFIIYIPNSYEWTKKPTEQSESTSRQGRLDLPIDSAYFLQKFKLINSKLLDEFGSKIECSRDYNWSTREITKKGEPITSVIEHGINRVNHASDCLAVLFKELKSAADEGIIKLAILVDRVNALFDETPYLKHNDKKVALPDDITPIRALKKLLRNDWNGGFVIGVVEKKKIDRTPGVRPRRLMTIDGWNYFEPCLPIEVPRYSRKEFETCLNFYQDINWLQRPESKTEEGREEIRFVSGMNPYEVFRLCRYL